MSDRTRSGDEARSVLTLLRGAQAGDEDALDALLRRTHPAILDFLRRRFSDGGLRDLEEDVAMEAIVRILGHLDACRAGTDDEYWAWALTIARHEALRLLRGSYFGRAEVLAPWALEMLATGREASGTLSALEPLLPLLRPLVAQLGEPRQELLGLRYGAGLAYGEIAAIVGTSESAARRRVQRIQARLRRQLSAAVAACDGEHREAVLAAFGLLAQGREM